MAANGTTATMLLEPGLSCGVFASTSTDGSSAQPAEDEPWLAATSAYPKSS
jgi:hypothetical protein